MRAQGAAPGSCGDFRGGLTNSGNDHSIADLGLPAHVISVLEAEGVVALGDWLRLGKRRYQLFGVVISVAKKLDQAARRRK